MTLACNILNAIGGHPVIADAASSRAIRATLPMGVAGGLKVHLKRYSKALVEDTFMEIEEPEIPLDIPVMRRALPRRRRRSLSASSTPASAPSIVGHAELFTGDPELAGERPFLRCRRRYPRYSDVDSALLAIQTIVEQGEGTPKSPLDLQKDIAHYYRFQQFSKGMRIVRDPSEPLKVTFDPAAATVHRRHRRRHPDDRRPAACDLCGADWRAEQLSAEADASYSKILRGLHQGFNGEPGKVDDPVGTMFEFKTILGELLQQKLTAGDRAGQFPGPRFRYVA